VTVTGHSKGGNLAVYVAVLRPDMVDHAFSLDGQGFNDAFILKYQEAIQQLVAAGAIQTYANAMDFVNILFHAIGQVTYITAPDDIEEFQYHHSPGAVFEESGGTLVFREESPQDPNMAMADRLVGYVERFMSADDFTLMCQMAVGLAGNTLSLDQIVDTSKLSENAQVALFNIIGSAVSNAGAVLVVGLITASTAGLALFVVGGLVFGALSTMELTDTWETVSSALKEPYKTMLDDFWVLLGNFVIENGVDDPGALKDFLESLFPGFWNGVGVDLATDKVLGELEGVARLPYSAVVRDFSETVKQELLRIVDRVTPHDWGHVSDFFSDWFLRPPELDFDADDNARRAYYQETMDKGDTSRAQIEQIFTDVADEDRSFSLTVEGVKEEADAALAQLNALLEEVRANVRAAGI
jgi:hypothetical protein